MALTTKLTCHGSQRPHALRLPQTHASCSPRSLPEARSLLPTPQVFSQDPHVGMNHTLSPKRQQVEEPCLLNDGKFSREGDTSLACTCLLEGTFQTHQGRLPSATSMQACGPIKNNAPGSSYSSRCLWCCKQATNTEASCNSLGHTTLKSSGCEVTLEHCTC